MNMTYFGALNVETMKDFGIENENHYQFLINSNNRLRRLIFIKEKNLQNKLNKLTSDNFFGLIYDLN